MRDKVDFFHADKHESFLQVDTMIFGSILKVPKIASFQCLYNILKMKWEVEFIFYVQINIKDFFKLIQSFSVFVARYAQITQNNKFAIFLQCLKKEVGDEIHFLPGDERESFLQIATLIFNGNGQAFPKFLRFQVCNVFTIS